MINNKSSESLSRYNIQMIVNQHNNTINEEFENDSEIQKEKKTKKVIAHTERSRITKK